MKTAPVVGLTSLLSTSAGRVIHLLRQGENSLCLIYFACQRVPLEHHPEQAVFVGTLTRLLHAGAHIQHPVKRSAQMYFKKKREESETMPGAEH